MKIEYFEAASGQYNPRIYMRRSHYETYPATNTITPFGISCFRDNAGVAFNLNVSSTTSLYFKLEGLPTSDSGLVAGRVYASGGYLRIKT